MTDSDLSALLGIGPGSITGIVGAGGKTTTMYRLCHEVVRRGLTAISTTTTIMQRPTPHQSPALLLECELQDVLTAAKEALRIHRHVTVARREWRADKLQGLGVETAVSLSAIAQVVVIEADGARHNAIKAPAEHEPVAPVEVTHFLSVAGLHALGKPLHAVSHRPEIAARVTGQSPEAPVTVETLSRLLGAQDAGLKGRPERAQAWALLTHLTDDNEGPARAIARCLKHKGYTGVVALSKKDALRLA